MVVKIEMIVVVVVVAVIVFCVILATLSYIVTVYHYVKCC